MMACARTYYDTVSLRNSAIDIKTSGGIESAYVPVVCHACKDPPCALACPTGALTKRKGGGVVLNKELCTGCGQCIDACLVGAIHLDREGRAIVCRHCGVCAKFCPHGVLEMRKVEDKDKAEILPSKTADKEDA